MKAKKSLVILMVLLFAGFAYANDYTYEGKIDPKVIVKEWKNVGTNDVGNGFIEYEFVNPDKGSNMLVAMVLINVSGTVPSYAYLENNEPYVYWKNKVTNCYEALKFTSSNHKKSFKQRLLKILNGSIPKSYA